MSFLCYLELTFNSLSILVVAVIGKFSVADLSSPLTKLPAGFDLVLSRDALQHLSYRHIAGAITSYCRSDAQFLLVNCLLCLLLRFFYLRQLHRICLYPMYGMHSQSTVAINFTTTGGIIPGISSIRKQGHCYRRLLLYQLIGRTIFISFATGNIP